MLLLSGKKANHFNESGTRIWVCLPPLLPRRGRTIATTLGNEWFFGMRATLNARLCSIFGTVMEPVESQISPYTFKQKCPRSCGNLTTQSDRGGLCSPKDSTRSLPLREPCSCQSSSECFRAEIDVYVSVHTVTYAWQQTNWSNTV